MLARNVSFRGHSFYFQQYARFVPAGIQVINTFIDFVSFVVKSSFL
jgi:hypothetical protein